MKWILWLIGLLPLATTAQLTPFEKSNGKATATYPEIVDWYQQQDRQSNKIQVQTAGPTDAGHPLQVVLVSNDGRFDPKEWHRQGKVVILINNGIHPGEPDGIDACMMLVRDIAKGSFQLPNNIALAIIPVYNIGGCLNRSATSRVNQNGPETYGFRGNSQNLDLNRDFIKADSKEALSFSALFHRLDPEILIDNHVSDGADYQYTITLITTQYNKLGNKYGNWVKQQLEPGIYQQMKQKGWEMTPYVNFETTDFNKGMEMFYDPPRYSSGYAALFQTIGFVPETHMLKPFKDRVMATYTLMQTMVQQTAAQANNLIRERALARQEVQQASTWPLKFEADSTRFDTLFFKGYTVVDTISKVTGMPRIRYDQNRPFTKPIRYFDYYQPVQSVTVPAGYVIPQGWHRVVERLKANGVVLHTFLADTLLEVGAYHIDSYRSYPTPYEQHHKNYQVTTSIASTKIKCLKGDYWISLQQPAKRYLIETLEPTGEDGFFTWNFFDAILQQKEGYSDYRWEDVAEVVLQQQPALQKELAEKRKNDPGFAKSADAQLQYIYRNSPYYEPVHRRYPVYRLNTPFIPLTNLRH